MWFLGSAERCDDNPSSLPTRSSTSRQNSSMGPQNQDHDLDAGPEPVRLPIRHRIGAGGPHLGFKDCHKLTLNERLPLSTSHCTQIKIHQKHTVHGVAVLEGLVYKSPKGNAVV